MFVYICNMKTKKITLTQLSEMLGKSRQYLNRELNKGNDFNGLVKKVELLPSGKLPMKIIHIKE